MSTHQIHYAAPEHCDANGHVLPEHKDKIEKISPAEAHRRTGKDHFGNRADAAAADSTQAAQFKSMQEQIEALKAQLAAKESA